MLSLWHVHYALFIMMISIPSFSQMNVNKISFLLLSSKIRLDCRVNEKK